MIALFLPLSLSLCKPIIHEYNFENKKHSSLSCAKRAPQPGLKSSQVGVSRAAVPEKKKKEKKKLIHLRFPPMAAPKKDRSGREIVKSAAACCFSNV